MIHSEVRCDGCGVVGWVNGHAHGTWRAHQARSILQEKGWRCGARGHDWCPLCRDSEVAKKAR
jgi:hypothetical protein